MLMEKADHIIDECLSSVQFDEGAFDQDHVELGQEIGGSPQDRKLGTLNVDLEGGRPFDGPRDDFCVQPGRANLERPDFVSAREGCGLAFGYGQQRGGVVGARDVHLSYAGAVAKSRIHYFKPRVTPQDALHRQAGLGKRLKANELGMRPPTGRNQCELPSICAGINDRSKVVWERSVFVLDGSGDAVTERVPVAADDEQARELANTPYDGKNG